MQLKDKQLGKRLALATGALLSGAQSQAADGDWLVSSAMLLYSESDSRVQAVEPVLNLMRQYEDESSFNVRLVFDALTGASPNGAMPARVAQTFTSASAAGRNVSSASVAGKTITSASTRSAASEDDEERGTYTTAPGDLPLDPSFEDSRGVVALSWVRPLADQYTLNLGGALSAEGDFTSLSVNAALARDFNNKATTVSAGLNLEADSINPHGGVPEPLSAYAAHDTQGTSDSKQVTDLMLGVTQVMNRRWLMQFNLGFSQSSGYQNDPYKILTVASDGDLMADPNDFSSYLYLYESRPSDRQKTSLYWQNKVAVGSDDVMDLGLRYMTDDWGIESQTADLSYHWQLSPGVYLEPHYRYYQQTAADFWRPFVTSTEYQSLTHTGLTPAFDYASSDPRLAAFSADTVGIKLGFPLQRDEEFSVRAEMYQQHDKNTLRTVSEGSDLSGMKQFSPLSASWIQLGYSFRW
ncbi:DUF3570 domain-containing protein [Thalassolituus sp. LLYu03]|uniref:DUF3570 domain-containing protein n=1 Tax=Thalassolituus sp. LLYu03 TaxID=3421656 RepID=UPI003D2D0E6F